MQRPTFDEWVASIRKLMHERGLDSMLDSPAVTDAAQLAVLADAAWDAVVAEGIPNGENITVEHENKGGGIYTERNPVLRTYMDLKAQTLSAWRELCLTPKSYRQAVGEVRTDKAADYLADIVAMEKGAGAA